MAEALRYAKDELAERGIEAPHVDAAWIVGKATGLSRVQLVVEGERPLSPEEFSAVCTLVKRRGRREPLAYVLEEWGFRRLALRTDRRALVPRPETEVVVERCLARLDGREEPHALDVGTGSGAIALALADEHASVRVTALDRSRDALALARANVERAGMAARVRLVEADLAEGLPGGPYDLVVCNPPYVDAGEIERLAPEVRDWEPRDAILDAGQTSLVARAARTSLRPGGALVLEVGWQPGRAERVARELAVLGYEDIRITPDLTGRERVVEGRRR